MSEPTKAVFLSYAREDADAARRIADALRSQGVEMWFDQAELRGGDQWDARIRGQIKTCALFIPVISASTQARDEAYFRLEWKLADDRSQLMAPGKPFIVPVVIDATPDTGAVVPESFARAQWTRLEEGVPSPAFIDQVKHLLEAPKKPALKPSLPRPPTLPPELKQAAQAKAAAASGSAPPGKSRTGWIWVLLLIIAAAVAAYMFLRKPESAARTPAAVADAGPTPPAAPRLSDKSIAVLPFTNMSEEKDGSAFFADGMHEDILTNLSFIRDLRVVSRTSVLQYRGTTKAMRQIAQELGVTYILEGSVRRANGKVRVTGQLIRAATDEHVWANNYDRDLADVFAIQAELSKAIAGALQAALSPETTAILERRPTDNPAAYDAYLRARQLNNSAQYLDTHDVVVLLRRAVELDPNFAAAWAELASREAFVFFKTDRTAAQLALASAAIDRAVRLAPDDPAVVTGLGDYYYYGHYDYPRATEQYLRLAQLRPNDAEVFNKLGLLQRRQGRMPEALPNFRRAADLDPLRPLFETDYIYSLFSCRKYAEAEARGRRFMQAYPGDNYVAATAAQNEFAAHGSTGTMRSYAERAVPLAGRAEHLYVQLQNARITADWEGAIRLDRAQRYFDGDTDTPRWLQDVWAAATFAEAGDIANAQLRAGAALAAMTGQLAEQPLNAQLWGALSLAHALLGHHDEAVRCGEKARALLPESRDAMSGAALSALCASALAYAGETDRALAEFERLLHVPFGTNAILDRGMWLGSWKPLRADPRFIALVADPKNNAPIF